MCSLQNMTAKKISKNSKKMFSYDCFQKIFFLESPYQCLQHVHQNRSSCFQEKPLLKFFFALHMYIKKLQYYQKVSCVKIFKRRFFYFLCQLLRQLKMRTASLGVFKRCNGVFKLSNGLFKLRATVCYEMSCTILL